MRRKHSAVVVQLLFEMRDEKLSVHDFSDSRFKDGTEESTENSEGYVFEVVLEKDPNSGLGLTLVDGNINGINGVYVKSVTEGGAGKEGVSRSCEII